MSSEARIVRPYLGVERVQHVLDGFSLQVGAEHLEAGTSIRITPQMFLAAPVSLVVARSETALAEVRDGLAKGLAEAEIEDSAAELVVVLTTARLKIACVAWTFPIADLEQLPTHHLIASATSRPEPLQTPFGGCRVDLYLCLSKDLVETPLRPWRRGTWLGHVGFGLSTELGEIGFTPIPLTAEERDRLQLSPDTLRFAEVDDPVDPTLGDEGLRLYVDEELLTRLAMTPTTPGAKAFQRQLFLDAMAAIVVEAVASTGLAAATLEDLDGSLLGRLIDKAAGPMHELSAEERRVRKEVLLGEVKSSPLRFIARIESWTPGNRGDLADALAGGGS